MTASRPRPGPAADAERPRPEDPPSPGERLAALLAEARSGTRTGACSGSGTGAGTGPGAPEREPAGRPEASPLADAGDLRPAHRWEVAARTRVPVSLLLIAVAGLAVLAWSLFGPGAAPAPEDAGGPVLAEMDTGSTALGTAAATSGPAPEPPDPASPPPRGPLAVHVAGEVARPGVVQVEPGARVVDAVEAAGGLTEHAATTAVNLAAPLADGQQVVVPDLRAAPAPPQGGPGAPAPGAPGGEPAGPVNLNTASPAELETLPRIGPVLAGRIVEFREQHGGFAAVEELDAVPGIGPALLEALLPLVSV